MRNAALGLLLVVATCTPSWAEPLLFGGVEVNGDLPPSTLTAMVPKLDTVAPTQDCVCFNRDRVQVKQINGRVKLVDGDHWILDFADHLQEGVQALNIIKHYGLNNICFVGRPFPDGKIKMMYLTADGAAPVGPFPGEDAIQFDPLKISAKNVKGSWKIVEEPDHWMLDFGKDDEDARDAEAIIKYYGFTHECFVGRPGAPLMYFRK